MNQHDEYPLLRAAITAAQNFRNPRGGSGPEKAPAQRIPEQHRVFLLSQLDDLLSQARASVPVRVDNADRELIAVELEPEANSNPEGLADKRSDVRLISVDEETGTALLDAPLQEVELPYLRRKIQDYANPEKTTPKGRRRNEPLVAPIMRIQAAGVSDLAGPNFRTEPPVDDNHHWFELSCRGGTAGLQREAESSRQQIVAALSSMGIPKPQEFLAAERVHFYTRLRRDQIESLINRTDCIYEFDLITKNLRTWLLLREPPETLDIDKVELIPPAESAASVVVLDTGILEHHPLLEPGVLTATSAVPSDDSPGDVEGHGTQMAGIALYDSGRRARCRLWRAPSLDTEFKNSNGAGNWVLLQPTSEHSGLPRR